MSRIDWVWLSATVGLIEPVPVLQRFTGGYSRYDKIRRHLRQSQSPGRFKVLTFALFGAVVVVFVVAFLGFRIDGG